MGRDKQSKHKNRKRWVKSSKKRKVKRKKGKSVVVLPIGSVESRKKYVQLFDRHRVCLLASRHKGVDIWNAVKTTKGALANGFLKKRCKSFCYTWSKIDYQAFLEKGLEVFDDERKEGGSGRPFKLSELERKAVAAQSVVDQDDKGITAKEFDKNMAQKLPISWGTVRRYRKKWTVPDKKATVPHLLTNKQKFERARTAKAIRFRKPEAWTHRQLGVDLKWAQHPAYKDKKLHYNWIFDTIFADEAIIKPNKAILYAKDLRGPGSLDIEEMCRDTEPLLKAIYEVKRGMCEKAEELYEKSKGVAAKTSAFAALTKAQRELAAAKEEFEAKNEERVLIQAFYKGKTVDMEVNKAFEWLEGQRDSVTHCFVRTRFSTPAKGYDSAGKLMFMPVFSYYHKASELVHFFDLRRDKRYTKNPSEAPWVCDAVRNTDAKYFQERAEPMYTELFKKMKGERKRETDRRVMKQQRFNDLVRLVMVQHDNASPHTAKSTRKWLQKHNWLPFKQPARSPDFQPTEMVICKVKTLTWELLRSECEQPYNLVETVACLDKAWSLIPQSFLQSCIDHVWHLTAEVIELKGSYVKKALNFDIDP